MGGKAVFCVDDASKWVDHFDEEYVFLYFLDWDSEMGKWKAVGRKYSVEEKLVEVVSGTEL